MFDRNAALGALAGELERLHDEVMKLRNEATFNTEDGTDLATCPPLAEQHALLALAALETAARHFKLAHYLTMRGE